MSQGTAPARSDNAPVTLLRPLADIQVLLQVQQEVTEFISKMLTKGVDYGPIPGVSKDVLLKPGAERLCSAFGVEFDYDLVEVEIDHDRLNKYTTNYNGREQEHTSVGLYRYVVKCILKDRRYGHVIGSCLGMASSMESKYISRPRNVENTLLKMAEKRALVGAVLNAFALSDRFNADMDDFIDTETAEDRNARQNANNNNDRNNNNRGGNNRNNRQAEAPDVGEPGNMNEKQAVTWLYSIKAEASNKKLVTQEQKEDFQERCKSNRISWKKVVNAARVRHGNSATLELIDQMLAEEILAKREAEAQKESREASKTSNDEPAGDTAEDKTAEKAPDPQAPLNQDKPAENLANEEVKIERRRIPKTQAEEAFRAEAELYGWELEPPSRLATIIHQLTGRVYDTETMKPEAWLVVYGKFYDVVEGKAEAPAAATGEYDPFEDDK